MPYLMTRKKISDYENWINEFKQTADKRQEVGLGEGYVLRDLEDNANVTVMLEFEYDRLDHVKAFANELSASADQSVQTFILDDAEEIAVGGIA